MGSSGEIFGVMWSRTWAPGPWRLAMSQDRSDIQYAVKELRQATANPDVLAMLRLKRLTRYLRGEPDVEVRYYYEQPCAIPDIKATKSGKDGDGPVIKCFVDSDWAGDKRERKSTL